MPLTFVVLVIAVSSLGYLRHFICVMNVLQALDSDGEETPRESAGASKSKKASDEGGLSKPAISEASSDGELVEIPDQELMQQKR